MRLLICGSRTWTDRKLIWRVLQKLKPEVVIHGNCPRGADKIADELANKMRIPVKPYPADWNKHGRSAGLIRNREMYEAGKPELVVAFRMDGKSNGTDDMISVAKAGGTKTVTVTEDDIKGN